MKYNVYKINSVKIVVLCVARIVVDQYFRDYSMDFFFGASPPPDPLTVACSWLPLDLQISQKISCMKHCGLIDLVCLIRY